MLHWNHSLKLGHHHVDEQHKFLVALVNELHLGAKSPEADHNYIAETAIQFVEQTHEHLQSERRMFDHNNDHCVAGIERLKHDLHEAIARLRAGEEYVIHEICEWTKEWLHSHIHLGLPEAALA